MELTNLKSKLNTTALYALIGNSNVTKIKLGDKVAFAAPNSAENSWYFSHDSLFDNVTENGTVYISNGLLRLNLPANLKFFSGKEPVEFSFKNVLQLDDVNINGGSQLFIHQSSNGDTDFPTIKDLTPLNKHILSNSVSRISIHMRDDALVNHPESLHRTLLSVGWNQHLKTFHIGGSSSNQVQVADHPNDTIVPQKLFNVANTVEIGDIAFHKMSGATIAENMNGMIELHKVGNKLTITRCEFMIESEDIAKELGVFLITVRSYNQNITIEAIRIYVITPSGKSLLVIGDIPLQGTGFIKVIKILVDAVRNNKTRINLNTLE